MQNGYNKQNPNKRILLYLEFIKCEPIQANGKVINIRIIDNKYNNDPTGIRIHDSKSENLES